jgi:hypothetical protein
MRISSIVIGGFLFVSACSKGETPAPAPTPAPTADVTAAAPPPEPEVVLTPEEQLAKKIKDRENAPEPELNPDEPRDWVLPFLDEVCVYSGPGTTPHDDFVDSFSQAMRFYADRWLNAGVGETVKSGDIEVMPQVLAEDVPRNEYQQPMENPYG